MPSDLVPAAGKAAEEASGMSTVWGPPPSHPPPPLEETRSDNVLAQAMPLAFRSPPAGTVAAPPPADGNDTVESLRQEVAKLRHELAAERAEKQRAYDALISLVGNVEFDRRVASGGAISTTSGGGDAGIVGGNTAGGGARRTPRRGRRSPKFPARSVPGSARTRRAHNKGKILRDSPRRKGGMTPMQIGDLRRQLQDAQLREKESTLRVVEIMEWTRELLETSSRDAAAAPAALEDAPAKSAGDADAKTSSGGKDAVDTPLAIDDVPRGVGMSGGEPGAALEDHRSGMPDANDPVRLGAAGCLSLTFKCTDLRYVQSSTTTESAAPIPPLALVIVSYRDDPSKPWRERGRTESIDFGEVGDMQDDTAPFFLTSVAVPNVKAAAADGNTVAPSKAQLRMSVYHVHDRHAEEADVQLRTLQSIGSTEVDVEALLDAPRMAMQLQLVDGGSAGFILVQANPVEPWLTQGSLQGVHPSSRAVSFYQATTVAGGVLSIVEELEECSFASTVPEQLLALYIARVGTTLSYLQMRTQEGKNSKDTQLAAAMAQQQQMLKDYQQAAIDLSSSGGARFKASQHVADDSSLRFLPTNCHLQELRVNHSGWHFASPIVTLGAPSAASSGFKRGGLLTMWNEFEALSKKVTKSGGSQVTRSDAQTLAELSGQIAVRKDVVFSQILTALVECFVRNASVNASDMNFWRQIQLVGFLAHFESLLSTQGDEEGMLEDLAEGVKSLKRVMFRIVKTPPCADGTAVRLLYKRQSYCVDVCLAAATSLDFESLPKPLQDGMVIRVVPVLTTQGVDEMQTFANRFGSRQLQDRINTQAIRTFREYYASVVEAQHFIETSVIEKLFVRIDSIANSSELQTMDGKSVDLLLLTESLTRKLRGGRLTCCSDGKDRTSMAATLESSMCLLKEHNLDPSLFYDILRCFRSRGVRRHNLVKNTGSRLYAFNQLQIKLLPELFRPPPGTNEVWHADADGGGEGGETADSK